MVKPVSPSRRGARRASQRQLRVGEMLRHALVEILARDVVRDPDLEGKSVTISEVDVSPDMRVATIYCSSLGGGDDDTVVPALNRARAFLRGQLGRAINLKFTPTLHFRLDHSFAAAHEMDALLHSPRVARDLSAAEKRDSPGGEIPQPGEAPAREAGHGKAR